jgi:hypothetical protein
MQRLFLLILAVTACAIGCGNSDRRNAGRVAAPRRPSENVAEGPGVRVYGGKAALLPDGPPCTAEAGAEGDRWCGFLATSVTGRGNLFVVNVSQVLAGVPVSCGEGDPNCLLLAEEVVADGNSWRWIYFDGDTLVYYDATLTPRVWRPGMEAGRVLAERPQGAEIVFCAPASIGTAVVCLELPDVQADPHLVEAELYVGTADGESEPLLHPLDHVIIGSNETAKGVLRFKCGFPAAGYVAWSTPDSLGDPEILKLARADDFEDSAVIASDVFAWSVSPDASRWHWITDVDGNGAGMLSVAPFPDASEPTEVLSDVMDYGLDAQSSLMALTTPGDLLSIPDPLDSPDEQVLLDQGVEGLLELSGRGHLAYAKHFSGKTTSDLFVARLDGTQACTLEETADVPLSSLSFSAGSQAMLWARATPDGYDAFYTDLADCSTMPLAPQVAVLGWIGESTIVLVDELDPENQSGSMRVRKMSASGTLDLRPPVLIAEHVTTNAITGSTLLYTVKAGSDDDGVYVRTFVD